ncbi:MAG: hypothetical protein KatS3mg003_1758 [Candidatus Nitrosocaldaceae archaeon]|nr:MAG: hypothetical protein KatS3mg003_1509 [Candidatus Nitrosocaldaceae archaeon]GIU72277.1 MAG: hypothetical protein KatS3mg003_1756 [Candidatus Nitrosocaldaceae archaeon]GIU72279.1 MAG: hypothetical protein KatS3mg003_1758 [Candidatus Nitrosocaldaceae archaeon]
MKLIELAKINDEKKAEEWLRDKGILKRFDRCIYCNNEHIGRVKDNCYRCYRCKKEWSVEIAYYMD